MVPVAYESSAVTQPINPNSQFSNLILQKDLVHKYHIQTFQNITLIAQYGHISIEMDHVCMSATLGAREQAQYHLGLCILYDEPLSRRSLELCKRSECDNARLIMSRTFVQM